MTLKMFLRYCVPWKSAPASIDLREGDVIFVQAFGRNTFSESSVFAVGVMSGEISDDERTLEWLESHNFDPGIPNKKLAQRTRELMEKYEIPAIVQWEVAAAFEKRWYLQNKKRIICIWPPEERNAYFDTTKVKMRSLEYAKEYGWESPIEVAHAMQITRAALIIEKLSGKFPLIPNSLPDDFDKKSVQWWTRNIWVWLARESLGRIHHLITGRV